LPRLSTSGLPVIIGTRDRKSLELANPSIARLYLNLFSLYRVISIPGNAKLSTITDVYSGNPKFLVELESWMELRAPSALQNFTENLRLQRMEKFLISEKSSPSSTKSWTGMVVDIALLKANPVIYNCLKTVMNYTCTSELRLFFDNLSLIVPSRNSFRFDWLLSSTKIRFNRDITGYHSHLPISNKLFISDQVPNDLGLGQLSSSLEAAGKVRVFAMVDS
jgi:hypothetical protein